MTLANYCVAGGVFPASLHESRSRVLAAAQKCPGNDRARKATGMVLFSAPGGPRSCRCKLVLEDGRYSATDHVSRATAADQASELAASRPVSWLLGFRAI